MIRISSMRLKHSNSVLLAVCEAFAINDKNLKYEIETRNLRISATPRSMISRSMIRISSMRLKRNSDRHSARLISASINDKNLKYEIETKNRTKSTSRMIISINDKNLKYEIETLPAILAHPGTCHRSMIRISSMRLKPTRQSRKLEKYAPINDKNLKYEIETYSPP